MLEPISLDTRSEIESLISKHHTSMSQYQIDHFVVGEKMTPYRILRQILLELETRYKNKKLYSVDLKIEKLEIEKLKSELNNANGIEREIQELKIERRIVDVTALEKNLQNITYEIEILENQYRIIKEKHQDTEELLFDESGEEEYWINKFIKEAQVDIMTTGRVGKGVLDAIMSLPIELQNVVIQNAVTHATNSNNYIGAIEQHCLESMNETNQASLMLDVLVTKTDSTDSE